MSQMDKPQYNIEKKSSSTAMFAAIHRYLSLFESNPDFSSKDSLSGWFVPPVIKFMLGIRWFRQRVHKKLYKEVPGTYEYVIARTKFFDEQFVKALAEHVPQVVILGAGYDTRALRYQERMEGTKIFELDTGVLQARKRKIFKQNKASTPANLIFCPITFGKTSIAEVLAGAGYDSEKKTLFLWEGVTYYLTESSVLETLVFIKNNAGSGSELVFDYFYKSFIDGECDYFGAKTLSDTVTQTGEPYLFGIEEGGLSQFIAEMGFDVVCRQMPEDLEKHYLSGKDGSLGKVYGFAECVHARLKT